jgi:hypothetical protein
VKRSDLQYNDLSYSAPASLNFLHFNLSTSDSPRILARQEVSA